MAEKVDLVDIDYETVCAKIVLWDTSPIYVSSFYPNPPPSPDPHPHDTINLAMQILPKNMGRNTIFTPLFAQIQDSNQYNLSRDLKRE